jgi:hypothetical protein
MAPRMARRILAGAAALAAAGGMSLASQPAMAAPATGHSGSKITVAQPVSPASQRFVHLPARAGGRITISSTADPMEIENVNSGKCLEVYNWGTADGDNVDQWTCYSGHLNQEWILHYYATLGMSTVVWITNAYSGLCLEVYDWGTADGDNVDQWSCYNDNGILDANQLWVMIPIVGGRYEYMNYHSSKAMEVYNWGTADGDNVDQWTYDGGANQLWH